MSANHLRVVGDAALQAHEAAEHFPLMVGADFDSLVADIREHGQREPIVMHAGLILDGRNRYRACQQLGIQPVLKEWDLKGAPPAAFVISMNLHRRHLSGSQRGLIAARIANLKRGQRADLVGKKQDTGIPVTAISQAQAAKLLNVSVDMVQSAQKVLSEGAPDEIAAIERGDITVDRVAKQIRRGVPHQKRKAKRQTPLSHAGKNPERIQRMQLQAETWAIVNEALTALTALPLASEVADIVAANGMRRRSVDERLARSLKWLKEFDDAWRTRE